MSYFIEKGSALIIVTAIVKSDRNYTKLSDKKINVVFEKDQYKLNLFDKQKLKWV